MMYRDPKNLSTDTLILLRQHDRPITCAELAEWLEVDLNYDPEYVNDPLPEHVLQSRVFHRLRVLVDDGLVLVHPQQKSTYYSLSTKGSAIFDPVYKKIFLFIKENFIKFLTVAAKLLTNLIQS